MGIKSKILMEFRGFRDVRKKVLILEKGQEDANAMMQIAHRLEKRLCIRNPKPLWDLEISSSGFTEKIGEKYRSFSG